MPLANDLFEIFNKNVGARAVKLARIFVGKEKTIANRSFRIFTIVSHRRLEFFA